MATYRIDGTVVKTENATQSWEERKRSDGRNLISVHTGSQWEHQELHRSRKGRYWIECWSQWQGSTPHAEWVSPEEAARWLTLNEDEIPEDLLDAAEQVTE